MLVTRERPGELAEMLTARGAMVIHVPLVAVTDPLDGGAALRVALSGLSGFDWLVVTSAAGAERAGSAAAEVPGIRLAAVGTATARELESCAGRRVELVPAAQRAEGLVAAFVEREPSPQRVLIAQADIAAATLADGLRAAGHEVTVVTAYRTDTPDQDPAAQIAVEVAVASADAGITVTQTDPSITMTVNVNAARGKTFRARFFLGTAETVTLESVADTYGFDGAAAVDANYGNENRVIVKKAGTGFNRESYLRFDVPAWNGALLGASLKLMPFNVATC